MSQLGWAEGGESRGGGAVSVSFNFFEENICVQCGSQRAPVFPHHLFLRSGCRLDVCLRPHVTSREGTPTYFLVLVKAKKRRRTIQTC